MQHSNAIFATCLTTTCKPARNFILSLSNNLIIVHLSFTFVLFCFFCRPTHRTGPTVVSTSIHFRFRNSIWIDNLWRERARNDAYYNNNTASAAFCREFSAPVHCALLKRRNNVNIISSRTTGKFNCRKKNSKIRVKNTTLTQAVIVFWFAAECNNLPTIHRGLLSLLENKKRKRSVVQPKREKKSDCSFAIKAYLAARCGMR